MRRFLIVLAVIGSSTTALAQPANPSLDKAREQYADLFFEEALVSLEKALQIGVSGPAQTAEIYQLTGIVNATLDQAGAAKSSFIKSLSIDPGGALPEGQSPKITKPFAAAQKVVGSEGIEIAHAVKSQAPPKLLLVVKRDPANLVAGAHATYWEGGGGDQKTTLAPGKGEINVVLSPTTTRVVLSAVDEYGNILARIGSEDDPIELKPSIEIKPDDKDKDTKQDEESGPFEYWWAVSAAATVGLAAGGTIAGLSASGKIDELEAAIADSSNLEFATDVKPLEDQAKSRALYANILFGAAGVGAIVTAVLFYMTLDDEAEEKPPGTVIGPMVDDDAVGVSATVRF